MTGIWKRYWRKITLIVFLLIVLAPVLRHRAVLYYGTADIQYVKGKVIRVLQGDLFADPVTGIDNFHPPIYHLILSVFVRTGIDIDSILLILSILNISLTCMFAYFLLRILFDSITAFCTVLLIPFLFWYMGPGYVFLATAFHFSIPIYLAGLILYFKESPSSGRSAAAALLWAIAFMISPVYLFIIILTFAHMLIFGKEYRRAGLMIAVFLAAIVPFFIQAYIIFRSGLAGTGAFALWRGIPDSDWMSRFFISFLSPVDGKIELLPILSVSSLIILAALRFLRRGKIHPFVVIAFPAYLLTAYHFNPAYASRIQLFLSIFLAAHAVQLLNELKIMRLVAIAVILEFTLYGTMDHIIRAERLYATRNTVFPDYIRFGAGLWENLGSYVEPDSYILAREEVYRYFILPYHPAHALVAYKSGEYFQLNSKIAESMLADYNELINSDEIPEISRLCRKYNIKVAVASLRTDMDLPAFRAISRHWTPVYEDEFFRIFRQPEETGFP